MNTKLKTAFPLTLAAGTLALALGGCGTMYNDRDRAADRSERSDRMAQSSDRAADRSMSRSGDRMSDSSDMRSGNRSGANTGSMSTNTPASVDAFAANYPSFPASANESAGITGHSFYCIQHYSQPGCQTPDSAAYGRSMRNDRRSDRGDRNMRSDTSGSAVNPNRN